MSSIGSSPLTCVSGFWDVTNKYGDTKYYDWFNNTLRINSPYVFFTDKKTMPIIKQYRRNLPTFYIECNIEDFYTIKYKHKMITHEVHCPSIELNLIWNEKIFLLQKAYKINPFNSDFFHWIDAGICTYRDTPPPNKLFPNINTLNKLPKDKFIYSSSYNYMEHAVKNDNYYHSITGTYILHKNIIDNFVDLYIKYMDKLVDVNNIWTDQVILTHIYKDNKDLFFKICDGYGAIVEMLYN